jgi:hypothetical protein
VTMRSLVALALLTLLAACQSAGEEYPSLAIRPAERATGTLVPVTPYVPPPVTPAVADRLGRLAAEVRAAHGAFQQAAPGASSAVNAARGIGLGSEAWSVAQVQLANLESARSRAMIALADLDRLYVDAATQGRALERVAATRDAAIAQVDEENATVNALLGALGA